MLKLEQKILEEIYQEAQATYPEEGCGFLLGKVENGERLVSEFIPAQNIQNQVHEKDPQRYPRDAKTAYTIDPREMKSIEEKAKAQGEEIICIFHSHPEHGVYFSDEDKGMAAPWGEPLFPNISYLVVSVYDGQVKNCSEFYWEKEAKDFLENKLK